MYTLSNFVTLLLGVSIAVTGVSSSDTESRTALTPTQTGIQSNEKIISVFSTEGAAALPTATPVFGKEQKSGGFSANVKKVSNNATSSAATTNERLRARDDFGSPIEYSWLVILEVGTPPQTLDLSLDIGSDGFVVFSTLEPADVQITDYPAFNPLNSTTAVQYDGYTWSTAYGGFSLTGDIYTDDVVIGDTIFKNITIEVTTDEPTGGVINTASGILGLADHMQTGASPSYVNSFLGSIADQLELGAISIWFNSSDKETGVDGTIDFGYIDSSKYTGEIAYTDVYNVNGETFWAVNISGIGAADPETGALLYSNMTEFQTILDTGSDTSSIPLEATWGWFGAINGAIYDDGGYCYDYPCAVNTSLPDLVLFIGDQTVVVPRNTFAYYQTMNPSSSETPGFDPSINYCTMSVLNVETTGGQTIIGQDILEGLFMVYDFENQRVGFANSTANNDASFYIPGTAVPSSSPSPSPSPTCTYTDPSALADTIVNSSVTVCTGSEFSGDCYDIAVNQSECAIVDDFGHGNLDIVSFTPAEDSNLRCTLYSDNACGTMLTDAMNVLSPGLTLSGSDSPQSIFCISSAIEPEGTNDALAIACGETIGSDPGCRYTNQQSWHCSVDYYPSSQFQWEVSSLVTAQGSTGTCWLYQDDSCQILVSDLSGLDMCTSDKYGTTLNVTTSSYVGSTMCI